MSRPSVCHRGGASVTSMQTRVLVAMLIYSSATAAEAPPKTALQLERKQNRAKTLLHTSSSRAAFADVNGPYHPHIHQVDQRMALESTRLMRHSLSTTARKLPLDRFRGGARTDQEQDVLPTLARKVLSQALLVLMFVTSGLTHSIGPLFFLSLLAFVTCIRHRLS